MERTLYLMMRGRKGFAQLHRDGVLGHRAAYDARVG